MMICPKCGSNSGPDFVDFSRGSKVIVVMKCEKFAHAWAFEVDQVKGPDGNFYKDYGENLTDMGFV